MLSVYGSRPRVITQVRVCQSCGETHAAGTPTPSGRRCTGVILEIVKGPRYFPAEARTRSKPLGSAGGSGGGKPGRPRKHTDPLRACKICGARKLPEEFLGPNSFICNTCRALKTANRLKRRAAASKKWYQENTGRALELARARKAKLKGGVHEKEKN